MIPAAKDPQHLGFKIQSNHVKLRWKHLSCFLYFVVLEGDPKRRPWISNRSAECAWKEVEGGKKRGKYGNSFIISKQKIRKDATLDNQ